MKRKLFAKCKSLTKCNFQYFTQGKGKLETYWLLGQDGFDRPLPDLALAAPVEEHEFK